MKNRLTALLLTAALAFAIGANAALSEDASAEETSAAPEAAAMQETAAEPQETTPAESVVSPAGTLRFSALRTQMMEHYYPLLALEENVKTLEEWDYARTEEELRVALAQMTDLQWTLLSLQTFDPSSLEGLTPEEILSGISEATAGLSNSASSLLMLTQMQSQYEACEKAYDDVRSGKMQSDNAGVVRQLRNLQDQTVIVGETLYITYKGLEAQDASLTRTIAALGRTEREMTLRCELGQISALTLQQVRTGLAQAESGQKTLRMNMECLLLQLKAMTGAELDGPLTLGALPQVTAQQLVAMDPDADYAKAVAASYELYDAKRSLEDAETAYNDAKKEYGADSEKNEWMQAQHTWKAAQYSYESTKLNFELKFRTLYAKVKDAAQTAETKRAALDAQELLYAASALKYEQGTISANALEDAKDTLASAKADAAAAERDLFSQYRSYFWAVEYGILNS